MGYMCLCAGGGGVPVGAGAGSAAGTPVRAAVDAAAGSMAGASCGAAWASPPPRALLWLKRSPQRWAHLESQSVASFVTRVFEDVGKIRTLKWDHPESGRTLKPMTSVLVRDRKGGDRQPRGSPVMRKPRWGCISKPRASEGCWGLQRLGERPETNIP